jgi:hypothetical protein
MFDGNYVYPEHDLYFREGLTPIAPSIARVADQHVRLTGKARPNSSVTIWASSNLSNDSFAVLGTARANERADWEYDDYTPPAVKSRFYRIAVP